MATKIVTKSGSGAPATTDLVAGELAVDLTNKRLYTENGSAAIIEVGSNPYNFTANHDGSAKLATTATGIDVTGIVVADGIESSGNFAFTAADGVTISAKETVAITIDSDDNDSSRAFQVLSGSSGSTETLILASEDAGVTLYFDNAVKLASTVSGIDVTGTVTADGATFSGQLTVAKSTIGQYALLYGDDAAGGRGLAFASSTTTGVGDTHTINAQSSTGVLKLATQGLARLTISSAGSVGIGTTTPDRLIDLRNAPTEDWQIRLGANNTDLDTYDIGRDASDGLLHFYGNQTGYNGYVFDGINGERMRIDSAGSVGIGTSSPATTLHVESGTSNTVATFTSTDAYALIKFEDSATTTETQLGAYANDMVFRVGAAEAMRINSSGTVNLTTANDTAGTSKFLTFGTTAFNRAGIKCTNAATYDGSLEFYTGNATDFDERMRIDASGHAIIPAGVTLGTAAGVYDAAKTLDDYEEGTWAPAYTGTTGGAVTYGTQTGSYTKVGNLVTVIGELRAKRNTLSGNVEITGLPFTNSGNGAGLSISFASAFATDMPDLKGYTTSTKIALRKNATNSASGTPVANTDLADAATTENYLYFSATYLT